jgi:hypothetical protein
MMQAVEAAAALAGPGGVHEHTLLLVMGDHGQTLNGDHGGGTSEVRVSANIRRQSNRQFNTRSITEIACDLT